MKTFIIAEKENVGLNIIKALSTNFKTEKGYFESDNFIVGYAQGHILTNYSVNDYEGKKVAWKDINVPFIPKDFLLKPLNSNKLDVIEKILKRKDVNCIVNAGDSEREGQLIVDNILEYFSNLTKNKTIYRLWIPELTKKGIKEAYENKKLNSEYLALNLEAKARSYVDWVLGINLSVLLTVKSGQLFQIGRLIYPIIFKIYEREKEIENFKKEKYYQLETDISDSKGNSITLSYKKKFKKEDLNSPQVKNVLSLKSIKLEKIDENICIKKPPKLFNLSDLQEVLSKKFNFSFEYSLKVIQKLYENGYLTYPRTDSNYLTLNEKEKIEEFLSTLEEKEKYYNNTSIYNDKEVESHSAIIPTIKNYSDLIDDDLKVYQVVRNRLLSNLYKEKTSISERTFYFSNNLTKTLKSVIVKGFLIFEEIEEQTTIFNASINDVFNTNFSFKEKETTPPLRITEITLSKYLTNSFNKDSQDIELSINELKEVQLGTQATRTAIIKKLYDSKYSYLELKGKKFYTTEKARELVELVEKLKINIGAERTATLLNKNLIEVYNGTLTINELLNIVKNEILDLKEKIQKINISKKITNQNQSSSVCTCPKCNENSIKENSKSFYCSKCDFVIWKNYKYFDNIIKIDEKRIKKLSKDKKIKVKIKEKEYTFNLVFNGKYSNLIKEK